MRCNRVSINIERLGNQVPKNYPADVQRIHVYCDDSGSIYAALSKAYAMAINELNQYERIGVRADVYTNEFSRGDYQEMHCVLPEHSTRYEDDVNLQYGNSAEQLYKDLIWAYEHSSEILDAIKACKDEESMADVLKERFGLNDYQVRKLSQIRFEMLTETEYQLWKNEIERRKTPQNIQESHSIYNLINMQNKKRTIEKIIKKLEAYFIAAGHCEEIMGLISNMEDTGEYVRTMKERYGLEPDESRMIRYLSVNDFSKEEREHMREQLERFKEELGSCLEEIDEIKKKL